MKNCIKNLRCFGKAGTTKGLADGLAAALHLSKANVDSDDSKCRKDAIKICILMREYKEKLIINLMTWPKTVFSSKF